MQNTIQYNTIRIDVVIPAIEHNLKTLSLCLQGLRCCITQQIVNIYIVAPKNEQFLSFCKNENVIFVDENSVLGYSAKDINFITINGTNRSGWIFQQLLKLAGTIGTESCYLVCDADHILLRPHCFISKSGKYVFYQSKEYHAPYYLNIRKLTGIKKIDFLSYVSHKMIFDKNILFDIKKTIEDNCRISWDKAICNSLDSDTISPFSEYELYGSYVSNKDKIKKVWLNKDLFDNEIVSYTELQRKYATQYLSVTFPY